MLLMKWSMWPKLGYPPLVTPFSQYVKNVVDEFNAVGERGRTLDDDR